MNTWLFGCVFCLALTPLLAFAHIQNTAHRQTANRSGPLLPGLCCAPVVWPCFLISKKKKKKKKKKQLLDAVSGFCAAVGLDVSLAKTQIMCFGLPPDTPRPAFTG